MCEECEYLRKERAGMLMEAGLEIEAADWAARVERCWDHRDVLCFEDLAERTRRVLS